jgi:hypothetical protein
MLIVFRGLNHISQKKTVPRRTYMKQATIAKLAISAAALLVAGQAFAHTGVRDRVNASAAATTASYNGFTITHGCGGDSGDGYPVLGQSAVFPTGDRVVWREADGSVIAEGGGAGILDTIVLDHDGTPLPDAGVNWQVTGYAGMTSPFTTVHELVDPNSLQPGMVEGLLWKDGAMEPKLNAIPTFKITVPKFVNNDVKQLNVRIGVINYCDMGKNAANDARGPYEQPKDAFGRKIPLVASSLIEGQLNVADASVFTKMPGGNGDNNRADWWFPAPYGGSALYNDPEVVQPTYWTTMTVINTSATGNRVVSIEPTGAAFDAILTGPNTRPFTRGNSNL